MKIEDCIVTVERRSLGGCLDLAFVFTREFAAPLSRLLLIFAVPSCGLVWLLTSAGTDMLIPSILIFLCFATLFNGALIAAMGPQVFGVPISTRAALRGLRHRLFGFLLLSGVYRLLQIFTGFCLVFPGVLVTAHLGHLPEVMMLEQASLRQVLPRLSWLGKGGGYGRNLYRAVGLLLFWALFSLGLFVVMDLLSAALFNAPVFLGRLPRLNGDFSTSMAALALDNPVFLTTLQAALWLPFPIVRLAWFFCYLDQRIRNECWDLELQVRVEARRLEELG